MQAEVKKAALSAERLRGLSPHDRYVFALAGHIFNELTLLQKWAHTSRRAPGDPGPQEDASVGVSMFLLRMLIAKTHEALDVLKKQSVSDVLRARYFKPVDGLLTQWDAALNACSNLVWLGKVRNKGAFHYLNGTQWGPHLDDAFCEGAHIYVGKRYGDTYFHWAEMGAALPTMREVNPEAPFDGLEEMLVELTELLAQITDCLARGLQAFLNGTELIEQVSESIKFEAPALEENMLHYFFADGRE